MSHRGAARKAFNEALAQVRRCLDQRDAERSYAVPDEQLTQVPVDLVGAARLVEPEQAADRAVVGGEFQGGVQLGLDALARGLRQWSASRSGKRRGPKTGFSRFKSRRHARVSCTFTTGAIRVDDATHVVLPRIGRVHTLEPASALLGRPGCPRSPSASTGGAGTARPPSRRGASRPARLTSGRNGRIRWWAWTPGCGTCWWPRPRTVPRWPGCPHPAPWPRRGPVAARATPIDPRRRPGSAGRAARLERWKRTAGRVARIHARVAGLRRDAVHQATTALACRHQVIVIEDPEVTSMTPRKSGAGRGGRGLNRALADAALGELRRQPGLQDQLAR